jgi:WD40 repeat protein
MKSRQALIVALILVVGGAFLYLQLTKRLVPHPCFVEQYLDLFATTIPGDRPYIGAETIAQANAANLTLIHRSEPWLPAERVFSVAFNSDASLFARHHASRWDIVNTYTGAVIWSIDLPRGLGALTFTPENMLYGISSSDVINVVDDAVVVSYSLRTNVQLEGLAINSRCIAVGASNEHKIRFTTRETTDQWDGTLGTPYDVSNLTFSPDGMWFAYSTSGDNDSMGPAIFSLWNLEQNKEVIESRLEEGNWEESDIIFSDDSSLIAVAYFDRMDIYDIDAEELRFRLDDISPTLRLDDNGLTMQSNISQLAFNDDGTILASGTIDGEIALWDTQTGEIIANYQIDNRIVDLAFNQNSLNLLVVDEMGAIWYWGMVDTT